MKSRHIIFNLLLVMFLAQNIDAQDNNRQTIAQTTIDHVLGRSPSPLSQTDPEFMAIMNNFIYGDVWNSDTILTDKQKELVTIVALVANQDPAGLTEHIGAALHAGVTPVEVKEAVYQCAPYMGLSKVRNVLPVINKVFAERGISLPLASQATVNELNRREKGLDIQVQFFGEGMRQAYANAPEGQKHIQDYLSAMCFGDFYTRNGLDLKNRELLTFCMLASLGGCEPQVKAHIHGNLNAGNNKETLVAAITQILPYIGYPRTLNAIACINEICK